jgi:hypothetical protein
MFLFDGELKQVENMIVDDEGIKPCLVEEFQQVADIVFNCWLSCRLRPSGELKVYGRMARNVSLCRGCHLFSDDWGVNVTLVVSGSVSLSVALAAGHHEMYL